MVGKRTFLQVLGTGLILLTLSCNSIFAPDEGELAGAVLDDCGDALAGVLVTASPAGKTASTDSGGRFVFENFSAGQYTLTAMKAAYADASVSAALDESGGFSCATPGATAPTIVLSLEGWQHFAGEDFEQAAQEFQGAVDEDPGCKDARNGLGWAYARLDSLEMARAFFESALLIDAGFLDAQAGLALVASAANDHDQVIASGTAVLGEEGDGYVFRRDENITSADLRLVLAQSYLYTAQYSLAQEQVDFLDPDNGLDPDDPSTWRVGGVDYATYEESLLKTIEVLGS
jgi:tetratricopeptide (TPR) repeat protein